MLLVSPENIASVMELDIVSHSFSELDQMNSLGIHFGNHATPNKK